GRSECVTVAGLCWHTNYECARQEAESQQKMLLVNFVASGSDYQRSFEKYLHEHKAIRKQLDDYVLVRVQEDERMSGSRLGLFRKNRSRLIDDPAFKFLGRTPGVAIIDY